MSISTVLLKKTAGGHALAEPIPSVVQRLSLGYRYIATLHAEKERNEKGKKNNRKKGLNRKDREFRNEFDI